MEKTGKSEQDATAIVEWNAETLRALQSRTSNHNDNDNDNKSAASSKKSGSIRFGDVRIRIHRVTLSERDDGSEPDLALDWEHCDEPEAYAIDDFERRSSRKPKRISRKARHEWLCELGYYQQQQHDNNNNDNNNNENNNNNNKTNPSPARHAKENQGNNHHHHTIHPPRNTKSPRRRHCVVQLCDLNSSTINYTSTTDPMEGYDVWMTRMAQAPSGRRSSKTQSEPDTSDNQSTRRKIRIFGRFKTKKKKEHQKKQATGDQQPQQR